MGESHQLGGLSKKKVAEKDEEVKRVLHILASYADYSNIKLTVSDGVWLVKAGGQMPDWKKHQLITDFRKTFKSCDIRLEGNGVNISGEATMRTRV